MRGAEQRCYADYSVGWICALPVELAASKRMLDRVHSRLPQSPTDYNVYTLGEIQGHNVVIACLPLGAYGMSSAAIVATNMMNTFPSIHFSLLVGVGGGAPSIRSNHDIRLGDVVVSKPTATFGGVVQYDYGKAIDNGHFQRIGALNKPPSILLAAIAQLQADDMIGQERLQSNLERLNPSYRSTNKHTFCPPFSSNDLLFQPGSLHVDSKYGTCSECKQEDVVHRSERASSSPQVHYGLIASANRVMRSGIARNRAVHELGGDVLCFEMEAAGLMDNFPCLVIRGIADYADSHKNKLWQPYAAAVAAVYAKELLSAVPLTRMCETPRSKQVVSHEEVIPTASIESWIRSEEERLPVLFPTKMTEKQVDELLCHVQLLALVPLGPGSWICKNCRLEDGYIEDRGHREVMWFCCQCDTGPMRASFVEACAMCSHHLYDD